jgi:hypothetical protein
MVIMTNRNSAWRGLTLVFVGITVFGLLLLGLTFNSSPVSAGPGKAGILCGEGSSPDYGFTYDLQQYHWTVNWQEFVSEQAVTQVDTVLDRLNGDSIAQTMILFQPQDQVGNRVNCAVHFLRYMQLGQLVGERKDNGFVFLIVVEPDRIDVHYGVGLGLPALTASDLTTLNRAAEDSYQSTHSLDQALLTLVNKYDAVARSKYAPIISPTTTSEVINLPTLPSGPLGILTLGGLLCLGIIFLPFLFWLFRQLSRMGINFNSYGSGSSSRGGWGFPSGGGGGSSSPSRGGGGSGRSGRGN